ncbi:hypothetical protein Peur_019833 [Populus x canadensis]
MAGSPWSSNEWSQCADDLTRSIQGLSNEQFVQHVNISLIVNDSEAEKCAKALHQSFFESGDLLELTQSAGLGMALLHRCK